jgi:hypothetical protein
MFGRSSLPGCLVLFVALFAWSRCAVKLRTLRSTNVIAHGDACQLTR